MEDININVIYDVIMILCVIASIISLGYSLFQFKKSRDEFKKGMKEGREEWENLSK